MTDSSDDILKLLVEIRDLLVPISACFEERYAEIQQQAAEAKLERLEELLTGVRRRIYPLLFDPRRLPQVEIAKEANTTQATVSRFVNKLLESGLIAQTRDETGVLVYEDIFDLRTLLEERNEQD